MPELESSDYQLVLPSGISVGHRSLMRYYKQSVRSNAVVPQKNARKLHKVLAQYRSLGWTATQQEIAARYNYYKPYTFELYKYFHYIAGKQEIFTI